MNSFDKNDSERLDILKKDGKLLLTDDQKAAVLANGRIIVSAAAGSGKTSTMVKRILLSVSEGISLKNILVLVYNTAAATSLRTDCTAGFSSLRVRRAESFAKDSGRRLTRFRFAIFAQYTRFAVRL